MREVLGGEMNLTNDFTCQKLVAVLPYEVCLRRQSAILMENSKGQHPSFPTCHYCEEGKKIRAKFPDWEHVKNNKRKKPDRINLRKDKKSG